MKRIKILASGALVIGLIGIAAGGSFLMAGTAAGRPVKSFGDYMTDGELYLNDGDYYKAIVSYEKALSERENDLNALQGLAAVYYRQADYEKETEIRNIIAEKDPKNLDNQVRMVELLINRGDLSEAKEKTEELMETNNSDSLRSLYNEMEVAAPGFSLPSGSYDDYQLLELTTAYNNALVHYTLDGSEPTEDSPIYKDGIVISYPNTAVRAKAFGSLGYSSDEVSLEFTITRPVEVAFTWDSYGNNSDETLYRISTQLLNKSWNDNVYNYEMAQIRELYLLGGYNVDDEPMSVSFGDGYYKMYDSRYTEHGNFTLDFVKYTPFIKTLSVNYQNSLDLSSLASLKYIENLSLLSDGISDISPLSGLTSLKKLALGWNNITDAAALSNLTELESLGLWNNQIGNVDALDGLTKLKYFDIAYNNVSRITCVSHMPELNEVWINHNHIQDISPLDGCEKLLVLMQADNPITNYGAVESRYGQLYKSDLRR